MKITRIHLDVDGVLADWTGAVCRLFGRDPDQVHADWPADVWDLSIVLGISRNEMWRAVDDAGSDLWAGLEAYPWADELWALCNECAPTTLLTSDSKHSSSARGKHEWIKGRFGRDFSSYLIGPDKPAAAHPGSLLIDDRPSGLLAYGAAGGRTLLFPAPWNEAMEHASNPLPYVRRLLELEAQS